MRFREWNHSFATPNARRDDAEDGVRTTDANETRLWVDTSTLVVIVDGQTVTSSITSTLVPASGDWDEAHLLEVTVNSSSWSYQSGDDVAITVVVSSEVTNGYRGSDSMSVEVRLHG